MPPGNPLRHRPSHGPDPLQRGAGSRSAPLPRWAALLVGLVTVAMGLALVLRPLTSLQALGLFLGAALLVLGGTQLLDRSARTRWTTVRDAATVALGVVVLVWLRHDLGLLAAVVAVILVASGADRLRAAARGRRRGRLVAPGADRLASGLLGTAEVVVGLLALQWPDLTLLATALVFAVRLVALGLGQLRQALRGDRVPGRSLRAWPRLAGSTLALLLALGAGVIGMQADRATPRVDSFYATPANPPEEPGVLLHSDTFTRGVPPGATGWRILYTTSAADGSPATASALVVIPSVGGPFPVVAWAHGTTGWAAHCAPSLMESPFDVGAMPGLRQVIEEGWAVVATDYTGLGTPGPHPYLIGPGEAHSVLDALRATGQLAVADLSPHTVVWGHSQGGHAALWTGQVVEDYAPDVRLIGVAAVAPAADVPALAAHLPDAPLGGLCASSVVAAYAAHYPEIPLEEQVIAPAQTLVREMSGRCLTEPGILASLVSVLSVAQDRSIYTTPPGEGALGRRLEENVPTGPFPVPVLVAQGTEDTLVLPSTQHAYTDRLCAAGEHVDYRTYPRNHATIVQQGSPMVPDLLDWTADRFAGAPAPGCD